MAPLTYIDNGDFEQGLTSWHIVSGKAFEGQPVAAASINSKDIEIDGKLLVSLGGDYWHVPYRVGQNGDYLIRVASAASGILDSSPFAISSRFLAYRLGGSSGGDVAVELRVPAGAATAAGAAALDQSDADGYVAVRIATPSGSEVLSESSWDLAGAGGQGGLLGATAKVRLRVGGAGQRHQRLLVDYIRLHDAEPPAFRLPLWGWADIHCHPMAQAGLGNTLAGHVHGPVEDLGWCLPAHGRGHADPTHPFGLVDSARPNDGSLATTGWTAGTPGPDDELGFRGWPAFDEKLHVKTHQSWIRRAYEGGLRLMVALVVHNELLTALSTAPGGLLSAQSDRDTVEPQVQVLREFVAHNSDWCGLAKTPADARALIEANKLAFVLGLETDSINGWIRDDQFSPDPSEANREAIHQEIHDYFAYLRGLDIVQVNLIHLSDNSFGGMALYDYMFIVNSWLRRNFTAPATEDGWTPHASDDEKISTPLTLASQFWGSVGPAARALGIALPPQPPGNRPFPIGDRNANGLTVAGEVALLEAMRLGMVIDMDHMSEHSSETAFDKAMKTVPGTPYPLVAAHNGARKLAPRPTDENHPPPPPAPGDPPRLPSEYRRDPGTWPSESMKSETQLDWIKTTKGMFGQGIGASDVRTVADGSVPNDCPGSSKTFAQGMEYLTSRLEMPVALGTDWNILMTGPGPRFGPRAASGLEGEAGQGDKTWADSVLAERGADAAKQTDGVGYTSPIRDWRTYRFPDSGLYDPEANHTWQAMALLEAAVDLTRADVVAALTPAAGAGAPALELALGLSGMPGPAGSKFFRAGLIVRNPAAVAPDEPADVLVLVPAVSAIRDRWVAMRTQTTPALLRDTAGPVRDFDYNLDGLSHYGLLPDMLQDLKNVKLSQDTLEPFFRSAERYIEVWERSLDVAAMIPHP